ncbi:hypothetical protein [Actinotalea solisilvae]|uniref:hypothetical protein n=1 Tax=Actinotalea solisilvae TaxID=2072922 RepID=UPI0018F18406|nr:hypothetical protein [Actinotalea solisilvae]
MTTAHPVPTSGAPGRTAPPETSLRGPVRLTVSGAVLCLVAAAAAVLVVRSFVGLLPTDLLDGEGGPGPGVVATVDAPGTATVDLEADTRYVVLVAEPWTGGSEEDDHTGLVSDLVVRAPDDRTLEASLSPGVNLTSSRGGTTVHSVGAFRTGAGGEHVLQAPAAEGGADVQVLVALDEPFLPFFAGIFGTVFGVFVAIGAALLGVPMLVIGIVWWRRRAAARRTATTTVTGTGTAA